MSTRKELVTAVTVLGISVIVFLGMDLLKPNPMFEKTISLPIVGESIDDADAIPIPFLSAGKGSSLKGSLTKVAEYTSGIVLYRVKFNNTTSEILSEVDGTKSNLFLVDTSAIRSFSGSMKLPYEPRIVLTSVTSAGGTLSDPVDVYGYEYSDLQSSQEKAAAAFSPLPAFNVRFPGFFFRSRQSALAHAVDLDAFAASKGIKWFRMDTAPEAQNLTDSGAITAVRLKPDTLTLLVVSDNVKIDVNPAPLCGNGLRQGSEQCDQENAVNGDGCSSSCQVEPTYTCSGSPSVCGKTPNLFVTQVNTPGADVGTHQHVIGQSGAPVLSLKFTTTESPALLTQFFPTVEGTGSGSIDGLEFFREGETVPFLTAIPRTPLSSSGRCPNTLAVGIFCASYATAGDGLLVSPAQPVTITIRPVIKNIVTAAGKQFVVKFRSTTVGKTIANVSAVTATPIGGTLPLFFNNGNNNPEGEVFIGVPSTAPNASVQISGNGQQIVLSKVAVLANGGSAGASGSALPIGAGTTVADFSVSLTPQSTGAKFRPMNVIFDVQSNNVSLKSFAMTWRVNSSESVGTCIARDAGNTTTLTDATGNYFVVCTLSASATSLFLAEGQTGNMILKATSQTVASIPPKVPKLRVLLSSFTDSSATQVDIGSGKSHFQYTDLRAITSPAFWMELLGSSVSSTQFVGPFCSNSIIESPQETCDDGNVTAGDGCSAVCRSETCRDGFLDTNGADNTAGTTDDEECDDGNAVDNDDCSNLCKSNILLPVDH